MKRLNTRWLLTFGLTSVVVSALLVAQFLGLMPDGQAAALQSRATLAESVAAGSIGRLTEEGGESVKLLLEFLVERNPQLLSAGLRKADGTLLVQAGDHAKLADAGEDKHSTQDRLVVPLNSDGAPWGRIELQFAPLQTPGWRGWIEDPQLQLIAFIALSCTFSFYFYLRRMLRHLDPSRAVPERVRAAFDTLTEGVLLADANEFIVMANRSFADLVGVEPTDLVGRKIADFGWLSRSGQPLSEAEQPWRLALASNEPKRQMFLALADRQANRRSFQVNCSPILSVNEQAGGVLMSLEDVTSMEAIQAELQQSKAQADDANRAKTEFLANMSHEIRTPMTAILGFTDVLRRGLQHGSADTAKYLETIHRNGRNLLELINGILDLSKVEAGRLEIDAVDVQPHRVLHEVIEALSMRAGDKGVGLRLVADGPVPQQLSLDATRLRQIVTNLVGNAIKFTDRGEVVVTERWRVDAVSRRLEIEVRDSGIGVAADKVAAIFEPFVQAEGSTTRKYGGTGLGLAISRKFARAMGGDITVTSSPGRGSSFTLSLIVAAQDKPTLISAAQAMADNRSNETVAERDWVFAPARVLVVDDSPENRELLRLVLEDVGLTVSDAENGKIAVDRILSEPFDLVLMDVHMPVMDGYTAVRQLRAQGVSIPIFAFTADALKGFEKPIAAAGFSGHLTKPIDVEAMFSILRQHLSTHPFKPAASVPASASKTVPVSTSVSASASAGASQLRDLELKPAVLSSSASPSHGGSPNSPHAPGSTDAAPIVSRLAAHPKLGQVVTLFVDRLPERIALMRQAAERDDWRSLAELAHWLKGSGGTVGFDVFTGPAKELERCARAGQATASREYLQVIVGLAQRVSAPARSGSGSGSAAPAPTTTGDSRTPGLVERV